MQCTSPTHFFFTGITRWQLAEQVGWQVILLRALSLEDWEDSMTSKVLAGVPYVGVHDNALGQLAKVAHPQQSPAKTMYGNSLESSSCPFFWCRKANIHAETYLVVINILYWILQLYSLWWFAAICWQKLPCTSISALLPGWAINTGVRVYLVKDFSQQCLFPPRLQIPKLMQYNFWENILSIFFFSLPTKKK